MDRISSHLLSQGTISEDDLAEAELAAKTLGGPVTTALVRLGALSERDLFAAFQDMYGFALLESNGLPEPALVTATVARLGLNSSWCLANEVAPWCVAGDEGETVILATRAPLNPQLQEIAQQWPGPSRVVLASQKQIDALLSHLETSASDAAEALLPISGSESRLREMAEEAPVIDFVNAMFSEAVERRASDIHLEPTETRFNVRMRVDGLLLEWRSAPRTQFDAVVSRIKLLSGMDIAERRLPQDGRQSIRISGLEVDLRVSSLPTTWGESVVLRLLGKSRSLPTLPQLGFSPDQIRTVEGLVRHTHGIILVTGPTGSGKSTTIYRLLSMLHDGERKILTVEDPVEFDLPGVMQTQARPDIGLTFAAGLRSMLRQDPDVIMVGEIRDPETASIAVQAALTGHLVISTLHTNSALAAPARMLDLGVEPFLLSDVLRGVIGQRLVRRLCACSETRVPALAVAATPAQTPQPGQARGCPQCGHTGFRGRMGLYELLVADRRIADAVRRRASEPELLEIASMLGFRTLLDDGLSKVALGQTTQEEIYRVTGG